MDNKDTNKNNNKTTRTRPSFFGAIINKLSINNHNNKMLNPTQKQLKKSLSHALSKDHRTALDNYIFENHQKDKLKYPSKRDLLKRSLTRPLAEDYQNAIENYIRQHPDSSDLKKSLSTNILGTHKARNFAYKASKVTGKVLEGIVILSLWAGVYANSNALIAYVYNEKEMNTPIKNQQQEDLIDDKNDNDLVYDENGNLIFDTKPTQEEIQKIIPQLYTVLLKDMKRYPDSPYTIDDINYIYTTPMSEDGTAKLINFLVSSKKASGETIYYNMSYYCDTEFELQNDDKEINQFGQFLEYIKNESTPFICQKMNTELKDLAEISSPNTIFFNTPISYQDNSGENYVLTQEVKKVFDNYTNIIYSIRESDLEFSGLDIYTSLKHMFLTGNNKNIFTTSTAINNADLNTISNIVQSAESAYQQNQPIQ